MGIPLSKSKKKEATTGSGGPSQDDKKQKPKPAEGEKKGKVTSLEKVRKQKILESVPHKVYDAKSGKNESGKEAGGEDRWPFYRPKLSKGKGIDVPIQKLQETFGMATLKSGAQVGGKNKGSEGGSFDLPKDQKQSGAKQETSTRKSVVLSSPKLKDDIMANRKATEVSPQLPTAQPPIQQKSTKDQEQPNKIHRILHVTSQKKDGDQKLPSPIQEQRNTALVAPIIGKFGFNPTRPKSKKSGLRMKGIQALLLKKDTSGTSKFLKILREKVHEGGDLVRLKHFGIPDQRQLLTVGLTSDACRHDFGGNLRHYYSPLLKSYIPNNMLERYRGVSPTSPCLTAIDLGSLGMKATVQEQERQKRKEARDKHLDDLHEAALDEVHFEFLKDLANNQPVSVPLTIMHDIAKEFSPMINQMQAFYNRHLGPTHECTEQATEAFVNVLNRVMMYNAL